jgi:hypothetical protein
VCHGVLVDQALLAHSSGAFKLEENTTLDASVSSYNPSSPEVAKPDINRYVIAPIRTV